MVMKIVKLNLVGACALTCLLIFALLPNKVASSALSTQTLDDNDKAQIVRSVLYRELTKLKQPRFQKLLLLDNENIKSNWLPTIPDIEIELTDQAQINSSRAADKAISYFFIGKFEIKGKRVRVSFGKHEEGKRSSSGSGSIYEYRKVSGKWRGRIVEGFGYCAAPGPADK